jgi:glycosyltransferase involved in cell wall biosynthesis
MRLLIDMQGAQSASRFRGIGRFTRAFVDALLDELRGDEIFLLVNAKLEEGLSDVLKLIRGRVPDSHVVPFDFAGPVDELNDANCWRVRAAEILREVVIADLDPDAILVPSLFEGGADNAVTSVGVTRRRIPTAVVLHDLIPLRMTDTYLTWRPGRDWYMRKLRSFKRADLLLSVSHASRTEAIELLGYKLPPTKVISEGVGSEFGPNKVPANVRTRHVASLGIARPFVLYASASDPRKNFERLVDAFAMLPPAVRASHQLVLVSNHDEGQSEELRKRAGGLLGLEDIVFTGPVSDEVLISLYTECRLFVFPSLYEGFGLPALEAMACGAPVIGSNVSSLPEIIGLSEAMFDPLDTADISARMHRALDDLDFRQVLADNAYDRLQHFSWSGAARIAVEALRELASKKPERRGNLHSVDDVAVELAGIKALSPPSDVDLQRTAAAAIENNDRVCVAIASSVRASSDVWRLEGPFDSSYSLALVNRELARGAVGLGVQVVLHSTEGPGDFDPSQSFLAANPDLARIHARAASVPARDAALASRNLYPPRVEDLDSRSRGLHCYAWEESGFPKEWAQAFNSKLDWICVTSEHVRKTLVDNGITAPVINVGNGVDHWLRIDAATGLTIRAKRFRFLHVSSCFPRKGVDIMLDAYGDAFTRADDVTLVIKTFPNPHNEISELISERRRLNPNYPDVEVILDDLDTATLKALYEHCHVLIAPSKAEGFGLPIAEAMLSGLPVITTAWSGQLDFCDARNAWLVDYSFAPTDTHFGLFSSVWAVPERQDLARTIKEAYSAPEARRKEMAEAGTEALLRRWTWQRVAARTLAMASRNERRGGGRPPLTGWLTTWNTRCGIATYSAHLVANLGLPVRIYAPHSDDRVQPDGSEVRRSWRLGKDENDFDALSRAINDDGVELLVIQFNYGFFNHRHLADFIRTSIANAITLVLVMHSTVDPGGKTPGWNFNLCEIAETLRSVHRILVHSVADLNRLKSIGVVDNVALFPHGVNLAVLPAPADVKSAQRTITLATYGFALPHKGLAQLIEAVVLLRARGEDVRLQMVNAEYPVAESERLVQTLRLMIETNGLQNVVELESGFLSDEQSLRLLSRADLIVFPYQQTGESASGAVRYGFATGRPVAVTPLEIFSDVSECTFQLPGVDAADLARGLLSAIMSLRANDSQAQRIRSAADRWRSQHDYRHLGERLTGLCLGLWRDTPALQRQFRVTDGSLKTDAGIVVGGDTIRSAGRSGHLVHGPYAALPAGNYRATIVCNWEQVGERDLIDVSAFDGARTVAARLTCNSIIPDGLEIDFNLDAFTEGIEVRIWSDGRARAEIQELCLQRLDSIHEPAPAEGEHVLAADDQHDAVVVEAQ